jgi:4,5-dihydroxyphthalate decarboxylase
MIDASLGCKEYPWVRPLLDGDVTPTGVDLTVVDDYINPQYYTRLLDHGEFDMAELSLGAYLAAEEHPDSYDVTAIPVFPNRRFWHSYLYVQRGSGYDAPSDLDGATVGTINWQVTSAVWVRGTFRERHDFDPASVTWKAGIDEYVPIDVPDRFEVEPLEGGGDGGDVIDRLERALVEGSLDAVITPIEFRHEETERLFSNPFEVERAYYRETGVFPIGHVVALRESFVDRHPWLPNEMYEAFAEALDVWMDGFRAPGWAEQSQFVWGLEQIEEQLATFDGNPWEYGLTDSNRETLSTAIQYAARDGIVGEPYAPEELFVDGVGQPRSF